MQNSSASPAILVAGGAGFIGSHMTDRLMQAGYRPVVLDNFCTGRRKAILSEQVRVIEGCLSDTDLLERLFAAENFAAVMHFASFIEVGESVRAPEKYYLNNVSNTLNLLKTMLRYNVRHLVFSSTAAVYGESGVSPIDESHPRNPVNPYGHSKAMVEQILADLAKAHDFTSISLRYFNAAGADPAGRLGEHHQPETHLIPLVLQTAQGKRPAITIHGEDYPTPDGTCIRDYVHVTDLCSAHLLALKKLVTGAPSAIYNLGNDEGYSVRQIIETARTVTGCEIPVLTGPRRPGDPAILIANSCKARNELGWQPQYTTPEKIIGDAWRAMQKQASLILENR